MKYAVGVLVFAAALVVCASIAFSQAVVDPSGHWVGAVSTPNDEIAIEIDIVRTSGGELAATLTQPSQNVKGLPITAVTLDGRAISFRLEAGGGGTLQGVLHVDGRSINGDFSSPLGSAPFSLSRAGDAIIQPTPRGTALPPRLEGRWTGTLEASGRSLRLSLALTNHPDGTSTGVLTSIDEGWLKLPVAARFSGRQLTVDIPMTGATFSGTVSDDATVIAGTFSQRQLQVPLTMRRGTE